MAGSGADVAVGGAQTRVRGVKARVYRPTRPTAQRGQATSGGFCERLGDQLDEETDGLEGRVG